MRPPFEASVVSAVRTCDEDKPNCRAMRAGVMPALKAARTAFSCPRVKDPGASAPTRRWIIGRSGLPAPSFHLSERYGDQAVQFFIVEMPDGVWKVIGQDIAPLIRRRDPIGGGRCSLRRRGLALGGRVSSHGGMMLRRRVREQGSSSH
jgi:hypothetical protein